LFDQLAAIAVWVFGGANEYKTVYLNVTYRSSVKIKQILLAEGRLVKNEELRKVTVGIELLDVATGGKLITPLLLIQCFLRDSQTILISGCRCLR
jgi:hypothetical protein